jgi:hypothetical protein
MACISIKLANFPDGECVRQQSDKKLPIFSSKVETKEAQAMSSCIPRSHPPCFFFNLI